MIAPIRLLTSIFEASRTAYGRVVIFAREQHTCFATHARRFVQISAGREDKDGICARDWGLTFGPEVS